MIPYLVGITGGSASGKTHFLQALKKRFGQHEVCCISQDDYYKPLEEQLRDENGEVNFDLPGAIQLEKFHTDLVKLAAGNAIQKQSYTFNNANAPGILLEFCPAPIILIEGLFIFYYKDIFDLLKLKIFIDASDEIKLQRRLLRDETERGLTRRGIEYQWQHHVLPAYNQYLLPYKDLADMVIVNNHHFDNSMQVIENHFRAVLQNHSFKP